MAAAVEERSEASMSTLFEIRHEYRTRVYHINGANRYRSRSSVDIIPIRFGLCKFYAQHNPEIHDYVRTEGPILLGKKIFKLRFSKKKASRNEKKTLKRFARFKRLIAGSPMEANKLRNKFGRFLHRALGLDEDLHPCIIEQTLDGLQSAVPDKIVGVYIVHGIIRYTAETLRLHQEDLYYRAKLIPAAESFIEGLEEVRSPPLELECPICMEEFAHKKDSSITKLPCSHYYHRDCIVPWLQINHLCPTCRNPN